MSPILTRPIREQLEHDRIIRQLQARYKRKHDVVINPGAEQNQPVTVGERAVFPDLVLYSLGKSHRLEGTVEVETGESVNQLEGLAEWGVFSKLKVPFHLYVPPQSLDTARRICQEHQFPVAEIWTYSSALDQVRFTQVYRSKSAPKPAAEAAMPKAATAKVGVPKSVPPKSVPPKSVPPKAPAPKAAAKPAAPKPAAVKAASVKAKPAAKPMAKKSAKPAKPVRPAKAARPAPRKAVKAAKPAAKRTSAKKRR